MPDRECIVWRDRRLTYAEVADRTRRLANHLLSPRARRPAPSAASSRGHESGPGPPRLLPAQRQRVPRGDARRVQGPGGAVQRELPLRGRGAPLPAQRRGRAGRSSSTPRSRRAPGRGAARPAPTSTVLLQVDDGSGIDLLPGAEWYEDALAAASPERPDVERSPDDLYILYTGGTTGMPKGVLWRQADIYVGAMGGRNLGHRRRVGDRSRRSSRRPQRRRPPPPGAPVHARRRPLAGLQRHEQRQHHLHPGRHRRARPGRRLAHDRARAGATSCSSSATPSAARSSTSSSGGRDGRALRPVLDAHGHLRRRAAELDAQGPLPRAAAHRDGDGRGRRRRRPAARCRT